MAGRLPVQWQIQGECTERIRKNIPLSILYQYIAGPARRKDTFQVRSMEDIVRSIQ